MTLCSWVGYSVGVIEEHSEYPDPKMVTTATGYGEDDDDDTVAAQHKNSCCPFRLKIYSLGERLAGILERPEYFDHCVVGWVVGGLSASMFLYRAWRKYLVSKTAIFGTELVLASNSNAAAAARVPTDPDGNEKYWRSDPSRLGLNAVLEEERTESRIITQVSSSSFNLSRLLRSSGGQVVESESSIHQCESCLTSLAKSSSHIHTHEPSSRCCQNDRIAIATPTPTTPSPSTMNSKFRSPYTVNNRHPLTLAQSFQRNSHSFQASVSSSEIALDDLGDSICWSDSCSSAENLSGSANNSKQTLWLDSVVSAVGPGNVPPEPMLCLHQYPRSLLVPCTDCQGMKLESILRMANIKHTILFDCDAAGIGTGPGPWLEYGQHQIFGIQNCENFLEDKFFEMMIHFAISEQTSAAASSIGWLLKLTAENHLHWGVQLWSWLGKELEPDIAKKLATRSYSDLFPNDTTGSVAKFNVWCEQFGRVPLEDIVSLIEKDLSVFSQAIGYQSFFINNEVSVVDCSIFSVLAQMAWTRPNSEMQALIRKYGNLLDFCYNMRSLLWIDWFHIQDEVVAKLLNEKKAQSDLIKVGVHSTKSITRCDINNNNGWESPQECIPSQTQDHQSAAHLQNTSDCQLCEPGLCLSPRPGVTLFQLEEVCNDVATTVHDIAAADTRSRSSPQLSQSAEKS